MAYGIIVNNNSGTEIFGHNTASTHFIASGTASVARGTTSSAIACEGMTANNNSSVGVAAFVSNVASDSQYLTINRGSGSFTISISNGSTVTPSTIKFIAFRK